MIEEIKIIVLWLELLMTVKYRTHIMKATLKFQILWKMIFNNWTIQQPKYRSNITKFQNKEK
jgi:hypothetical protein